MIHGWEFLVIIVACGGVPLLIGAGILAFLFYRSRKND